MRPTEIKAYQLYNSNKVKVELGLCKDYVSMAKQQDRLYQYINKRIDERARNFWIDGDV